MRPFRAAGWALWLGAIFSLSRAETRPSLNELLEPIRAQHHLPALAGAVFTTDGIQGLGAAGVRKAGTQIIVTMDDSGISARTPNR